MSIQIIKRTIFVIFILMPVYYLNGQTELPESQHYFFKKLADGVYAAIHNDDGGFAICNAGIVDLGDKTIVIDPFISPTAARDLKKHAESLTEKPVSLVLNLDPHNDHTRGNQVFSPEADIIGTANARRYIENTFHNGVEYEKKASPKERTKTGSLNYLCP
ncbi:MBL fold metallo-hydrolase, partial [candidate division KSB1 bacterium]|nr:MBL fold metallo-hydrolase [candidate division KSB1 bacterium]